MDVNLLAVVFLIVVALIFDYINGFHDAANSIATVVSTRVLSPGLAVLWVALYRVVGLFALGGYWWFEGLSAAAERVPE